MNIILRAYQHHKDYNPLMKVIESEGEEWKDYLQSSYANALQNSITYVVLVGDELCGYSRSIKDNNLYIWVIDLLVHKEKRGMNLGKKLMECILQDYPEYETYVMSDVDGYYEKLGIRKEGSIYRVK
jgi:GNAT superfamily N-acetyltransferase